MLQHADFSSTATAPGPLAHALAQATGAPAFRVDPQARRLDVDNSRAIPPRQLGIGEQGMPVSPELSALLDADTFDTSATRDLAHTLPPEVNHNVPRHDWRYMTMGLRELLTEVGQRALDEGPPDAVPIENPGVPATTRRLGDMRFALQYQPGREADGQRLLNAGRALDSFWYDYRELVAQARARRPELESVIAPWAAGLAQTAIELALQLPLAEDGQAQYDPALYTAINALAHRPVEDVLDGLERQANGLEQGRLQEELRAFFERISSPASPESPIANGVVGARRNLVWGADLFQLLKGNIVFVCQREELAANLRTIPAGTLRRIDAVVAHLPGRTTRPRYALRYPDRASGTTIDDVYWRDEQGTTRRVAVVRYQGRHSFLIDGETVWQPTGGGTGAVLEDMRAEAWRSFLAQRWHAYNQALVRGWTDTEVLPRRPHPMLDFHG
ncbi:hypothetical protein GT347_07715 [Xylophilus rhododendri]|uniref:Uncharacterized protein n=1 Tax=Xylophilus rhododendri TaxID=2697032 RepID=A0A857J4B4_9BURK|nr:hypothetical protein [Xylophilus rhododendri]QHI97891.1 hypothetical protein GT347_07715 [Xylophilus rhododendri]